MQRKVKKGCGRVRNMPVKDLKHLFTRYEGCKYITAGKLYKVWPTATGKGLFRLKDNDGHVMVAPTGRTSAHFHDIGRWEHPFK